MKDGFLRVGAASPKVRVADVDYNVGQMVLLAKEAAAANVSVLVFPELCVTAYTCQDLFFQRALLEAAERGVERYIDSTRELDLISFIGAPVVKGAKLYNCAIAISRGRLLGIVPKSTLPNYSEFYEARHFKCADTANEYISYAGCDTVFGTDVLFASVGAPCVKIAAEICEDVWVTNSPSARHVKAGANLIVNLSASNEVVGKADFRRQLIAMHSAKISSAYIYANPDFGESTTDCVYAGHCIIAECGKILKEAEPFSHAPLIYTEIDLQRIAHARMKTTTFDGVSDESYVTVEFDLECRDVELSLAPRRLPFVPARDIDKRCDLILNIQAHGLAARIERSHSKCVVLGVSGGLDSTLALIVCARAMDILNMPRSNIKSISMPGFGTTERTKSNGERLAEQIGAEHRVVDITSTVRSHFADIGHDGVSTDVVFENAQARERTQILMDIANALGGLVVGTGDLSELALGWATYNGDHMSMYAVNAAVPKTLIRYITAYVAEHSDEMTRQILDDILATPVSPELLPANNGEIAQCTEDIVGPYELHDYFLYHTLKYAFSPKKILRLANATFKGEYDEQTIRHWYKIFLRRFFNQQFKRSCMPDGPKVGEMCLSPRGDWRMPSDASSAIWLAMLEE